MTAELGSGAAALGTGTVECDHCGQQFTPGSAEPCPARTRHEPPLADDKPHVPVDPRDYTHPTVAPEVTRAETERLRELSREVRGFPLHTFGIGAPPADDAARAASELVARLTALHPDRVERLLVVSRVAAAVTAARDALLAELLEGHMQWGHYARHCRTCEPTVTWEPKLPPGEHSWRGSYIDSLEVDALATLTGLSSQAIRARAKKIQARVLAEAEAAYAALHAEVEG